MLDIVSETARNLFVPLTVGGGIRTVSDMREALNAGADKVSVNSAAVNNPGMITECAERFGKQCVVVAIDAKRTEKGWEVYVKGGKEPTGIDALEWAGKAEDMGAGEILLTSIDADGTKKGYDIPLTKAVVDATNIPVVASGGCGNMEDIYQVFEKTDCSAALAASIFHYNECTVQQVHDYLRERGIEVR